MADTPKSEELVWNFDIFIVESLDLFALCI